MKLYSHYNSANNRNVIKSTKNLKKTMMITVIVMMMMMLRKKKGKTNTNTST